MSYEDVIQILRLDGVELDLNHAQAVSQWSQALAVSEATLRCAVADVGPLIADIREHLGR
jgi:hypothetical protein